MCSQCRRPPALQKGFSPTEQMSVIPKGNQLSPAKIEELILMKANKKNVENFKERFVFPKVVTEANPAPEIELRELRITDDDEEDDDEDSEDEEVEEVVTDEDE